MRDYHRLHVWERAFAHAKAARAVVDRFPRRGYTEIKDQMRSAAESIVNAPRAAQTRIGIVSETVVADGLSSARARARHLAPKLIAHSSRLTSYALAVALPASPPYGTASSSPAISEP